MELQDIRSIEREVRGFSRPVLSLYASVNPGHQSTRPPAVLARVKNTLRDLQGLPDTVAERVLDVFQRAPHSRSVAVFADEQRLEVVPLDVELVDDRDRDHLDAHFGEPYFTPLLAAFDQHRPSLVVLTTRDQVRTFRVVMNEIETLFEDQREAIAEEQDEPGQSENRFPQGVRDAASPQVESAATASNQQNQPKYVADRGDAAVQLVDEHIEASQVRFYQESGKRLEEILREQDIERVLLVGPEKNVHLFQSSLSPEVERHVEGLLPDLPVEAAKPKAILDAVRAKLDEVEQARKDVLLDAASDHGVVGIEACLSELQQRRLQTLIVPRRLQRAAFRDESTRYLALTREAASAYDESSGAVEVDLAQTLPEVAEDCGARLEFVSGEAENRLVEQLDGMAGIRRW